MATAQVDAPSIGWRTSAEQAARRLAASTAVGTVLGLLVGGVGGRVAMMLLARLNPEATGATSDDGFRMGQFTVPDTLRLLLLGAVFGVVGAGVYAVVRGLLLGPRWFQILSVAGGPAVVVGAQIVHTDGVDFQLLDPGWLAIGLFLAIPGTYAALLTLFAEGRLDENGWFMRAPLPMALVPLLVWIPVLPLLGVLALLWASSEALRRSSSGVRPLTHPAMPWAARLGLAAIFGLSLVDLGKDAAELI